MGDIGRQAGTGPGDYAHTVEQLGTRIQSAEHRLDKLSTMRETLSTRGELMHDLRGTVRDFSRADLGRFGGLVSERQYGFALKIASGVRDVLLGRDRDAVLGL